LLAGQEHGRTIPLAGMVRVVAANSRLRALSSIGIAVNNVINGGKNDLRRNGLAD
jgi:hypothetical protein